MLVFLKLIGYTKLGVRIYTPAAIPRQATPITMTSIRNSFLRQVQNSGSSAESMGEKDRRQPAGSRDLTLSYQSRGTPTKES